MSRPTACIVCSHPFRIPEAVVKLPIETEPEPAAFDLSGLVQLTLSIPSTRVWGYAHVPCRAAHQEHRDRERLKAAREGKASRVALR